MSDFGFRIPGLTGPRVAWLPRGTALLALLTAAGTGLPASDLRTPKSAQDEGPRNTAHVKLYPELDQLVERAGALVAAGRHAEALTLWEEALARHPGTLVPIDAARARGISDWVGAQIAALPEEGRAAHRRRVDPPAQHLFETAGRARDAEALERIAGLYTLSSWADDALALAGTLRLDAGEDERAAAALERALELGGGAEPAVTSARLGLALSRSGRKAALVDLARRAERDLPGAEVRLGGKGVPLGAYLQALAARTREARAAAPALELPAWEMMGGAPSGSKLAEPAVELARLAWADTVGVPRFDAEEDFGIRRGMALAPTAEFRPLFPAVSDGLLFVHNGIAVTAYNLFARQPDRLWQFRVPAPAGEVMFDNRVIYAVTVHDGRVYANLITAAGSAEDQLGYVRVKFPFPRRALFALDAASGKPLWKVGGQPRADALEENASFAAPPAPHGGRLYAGAVKQKHPTDPFEHYVLCLDPGTGKVLWSTFVASGGTEINLFGNSTRESLGSPVAVAGDTAYYVTNHGVAAALDTSTGRLRWTYRYRQVPVTPTRSVYVAKNRLEWVNSPPVVSHGVAVVTPTDSMFLFALDARTGELRWQRPRGREVRTLYGVRDRVLVLGGERLELLDVRSGEPTAPPSTDELLGTGRGVVAEDGYYVPCRDKLRKLAWDGAWDEARARPWPGGPGEGGNLLVVEGVVVLATQEGIQVYFDRKDQERAIRDELQRDPHNPAALYRGAIRFLQSGQPGEAAELLSRVVERTAGSARPEDERLRRAARRRLFAVSMEAGRGELSALRLDRAAERFRAAREAAPDLASAVEASMMLGQAHLARKEAGKAVEEYQDLLARHGRELASGRRVFDLAREAIDGVIRAAGREAYAPQEEAARARLAEALREGTADAFLAVFSTWPNSLASEEALYRAAGAHARLGRADDEIAALRQFLREYSASARSPEAHAALAGALERKGQFAGAAALLRRMLRAFPEADVPDGEGRVKAKVFAERRLASEAYRRAAVEVALPALSPPLRRDFDATDRDYPEGAPLQPAGATPAAAADLLLMNYGVAVKAVDLGRKAPAWHLKVPSGVRAAAFAEDALLVADDAGVQRVGIRDGSPEWRHDAGARVRGFAVSGASAFFLSSDPRNELGSVLTALDASRGTVAWSQSFEGVPSSRVFPAGDAVVFTTVSPNRIHLFEAETGKRLLADAPFTPGLSARVVHVQDDLLVLHAERRFLEGYELPGGGLRWRVNLERYSARGVEAGPAGLVLLGTQRAASGEEPAFLAVVSLRTGKIVRLKEDLPLADPRFLLLEGERAFVVSKEPDRSIGVRAVRLADLSVEWSANAGEPEATLLPPALAKDHVVLTAFEGNQEGKYAYRAVLLDKKGRMVQTIRSEFFYDRPPGGVVANGRIVFAVQNKVDVHR